MSIIFLLLFLLSFTSSVLSTKDDEIVLLKIKKQLGNPDILQSWVKGFNFCNVSISTWPGYVYTGCTSPGRVSILSMQYINITAPFPYAVCGLTELEVINISDMPGLYGPIPFCITKLFNLHYLHITHTSLSGSVPSFYNHTNITTIDLAYNHLSGTIPPSLSTLPNLQALILISNYLSGTIPPSLTTLRNLQNLILSSNYLSGTIPPGLAHGLPDIYLSLYNNNLTGELPKCYGLVDFYTIDLGNNRLSGDASFLLGKQKRTKRIVLANNDFEFDLSRVEFSDNLHCFDISHNKIYGEVPKSFATAAGLYYANLSFNRLCGELPMGGNMCQFDAAVFANNTCLSGNPPAPCSISAFAPAPVPVSDAQF